LATLAIAFFNIASDRVVAPVSKKLNQELLRQRV